MKKSLADRRQFNVVSTLDDAGGIDNSSPQFLQQQQQQSNDFKQYGTNVNPKGYVSCFEFKACFGYPSQLMVKVCDFNQHPYCHFNRLNSPQRLSLNRKEFYDTYDNFTALKIQMDKCADKIVDHYGEINYDIFKDEPIILKSRSKRKTMKKPPKESPLVVSQVIDDIEHNRDDDDDDDDEDDSAGVPEVKKQKKKGKKHEMSDDEDDEDEYNEEEEAEFGRKKKKNKSIISKIESYSKHNTETHKKSKSGKK